jgi:hypothetical protein
MCLTNTVLLKDGFAASSPASMLNITIGFSRIMTEIQGRLMTATSLPFTESLSLDAHLVDWYEALPAFFHEQVNNDGYMVTDTPKLTRFAQPCATIKWRYLNLRMLLYRPSLMEAVLHRIPFRGLTSDQRLCVRKCLTLSGELIDSVKKRSSAPPNQYIAWPSTWYLLQTCMVPLLSLYVFREDPGQEGSRHLMNQSTTFSYSANAHNQVLQVREECHKQVQTTIQLMKEMQPWAVASDKMHDLIVHLYQARRQNLRVWNNVEESPVLVMSSPHCSSTAQSTDFADVQFTQPKPKTSQPSATSASQPHIAVSSNNMMTGATMAQYNVSMQQIPTVIQYEQFSRDWTMYNGFAWPNASLESLFDLPDDFQYTHHGNYDMG